MQKEHTTEVDVTGSPCRFEALIREEGPLFAARIDINQQGWMFEHYFQMHEQSENQYSRIMATSFLLPVGYTVDTVTFVEDEVHGDYLAVTGHHAVVASAIGEWVMYGV